MTYLSKAPHFECLKQSSSVLKLGIPLLSNTSLKGGLTIKRAPVCIISQNEEAGEIDREMWRQEIGVEIEREDCLVLPTSSRCA